MVKSSPYDRLDEEKSTTPRSGRLSLEDLTDLVAGGTVDTVLVEMNTVDGDEMSSWRRGNGDMAMIPDLGTLRRAPWLPGAALVTADLQWLDNGCVVTSPRQILKVQLARLTLMAKFNEREDNSCHIHISLRGTNGSAVFAVFAVFAEKSAEYGISKLFRHFLAGQLAVMREPTLFSAPNINSYKRQVSGSFAPTPIAWGLDNRTCALRVVGAGLGCGWRTGCPAAT